MIIKEIFLQFLYDILTTVRSLKLSNYGRGERNNSAPLSLIKIFPTISFTLLKRRLFRNKLIS